MRALFQCSLLRPWLALVVMLPVILLGIRLAAAEDIVVPLRTQAQLIVKLAEYDRNLVARPGPRVVLIVRSKTTASSRTAEGIASELGSYDNIAGVAHVEKVIDFVSAGDLKKRVHSESAQIVYFCPDFEAQIASIADELTGLTVLSVGAAPSHPGLGSVVGFDIHSGRTQLLVNLKQAQRQNVQLHSEFLKIVKVIR